MDNVTIEKERLFDSIKYTIFYEASKCLPANDLYHVSLKKLVPTRSVTELPKWGLRCVKVYQSMSKTKLHVFYGGLNNFSPQSNLKSRMAC